MQIQKRINELSEQLHQCQENLALLESDIAQTCFEGNDKKLVQLEADRVVMLRNIQRIQTGLKAGKKALTQQAIEQNEKLLEKKNSELEKLTADFLLDCEKLSVGCQSIAGLVQQMEKTGRNINIMTGKSLVNINELPLEILLDLGRSTGVQPRQYDDLSDKAGLLKNPLHVRYHNLKSRARIAPARAMS